MQAPHLSIKFTIYSRPDCHLCDEMVDQLRTLEQVSTEQINRVDIEADPALVKQFGMRIPVLIANGVELCHGHLDRDSVTNFIIEKTPHSN